MKVRTALFDFDGTLFDTVEGITKSIQYALRKRGIEEPLEKLRVFAGPPLVDKFMELYGVDQAEAERLVTDFRERYVPVGVYESAPFPGIEALLIRLRAAGITVGVATSKPQAMAELLLDRYGLRERFDLVAGSSPGINNEKKQDIVRRAMELCGASPESTVLVGDRKYDAEGAALCGIPCIGVAWGYAEPGELEAAGVERIAADPVELEALLTGKNVLPESVTELFLPYPGRGERPVRVYVPAHEAEERFPVIYMTDGQNLFDVESSGFGCWYTREAVRHERAVSGQAAIIVGVHNEDPWRMPELTPASIGELAVPPEHRGELTRQEGEVFDEFLIRTVMPAVETRFPVRTGRGNTAFCGSSAGGVMAFFTALSHPELWCAAGVFSPAFLLYRPEDLERWTRARSGGEHPFLELFSGAGDELERMICRCTEAAAALLRDCWPADRLRVTIQPEQRHHESAWEPRFRDFLHTFLTEGPTF